MPTKIANLLVWLPADQLTGLSDGNSISTFTDQSGNGNNFTASGTVTYKVNIINGKPVARFGSGTFTKAHSAALMPAAFTIFVVLKMATSTSGGNILDKDGASGGFAARIDVASPNVMRGFVVSAGSVFTTALGSTGVGSGNRLIEYSYDGTVRLHKDGTQDGSATGSMGNSTTTLTIGQGLSADMAEFIFYGAALTAYDKMRVRRYVYRKYAIAGVL
ncbi:MAG: hypothetical protein NTZ05_20250 [Chloroflexi bacterium]|nr:hypothetical protein [Chloroflexota bacterium]